MSRGSAFATAIKRETCTRQFGSVDYFSGGTTSKVEDMSPHLDDVQPRVPC